MQLPPLVEPHRYRGLYVFSFEDWTAVGYTAEEVAVLLESDHYADARIYKIHRATPDGQLELRGVANTRFQAESGIFFYRNERAEAERDFVQLHEAAQRSLPPCRMFIHLAARLDAGERGRYVVALVYPAEYDDEVGRWLLDLGYEGGDWVEGGISQIGEYHRQAKEILQREQLWSHPSRSSRSREEVLRAVGQPLQR